MTNEEKLRALLAEAQHALLTKDDDLAASLDARIDAALAEPVRKDGYPSACAWCPEHGPLRATDEDGCCPFCGSTAIGKGAETALLLQRERYETRIAVERLRDKARRFDLDQAGIESRARDAAALVEARDEIERLTKVHAEWREEGTRNALEEIDREIEKAFRRGAKAMREAAAIRLDAEGINGSTGPYFGNIIRALPVPEDEP